MPIKIWPGQTYLYICIYVDTYMKLLIDFVSQQLHFNGEQNTNLHYTDLLTLQWDKFSAYIIPVYWKTTSTNFHSC